MATEKQKELLTRYTGHLFAGRSPAGSLALIRSNEFDQELLDIIEGSMENASAAEKLSDTRRSELYKSLLDRVGIQKNKPVWPWRAIAAAFLFSFGLWCLVLGYLNCLKI